MSRPAMRQLSSRLRYLRPTAISAPQPISRQCLRASSRYSNPSARTKAAASPITHNKDFSADALERPLETPRNPYDATNAEREYARFKAFHMQRMRFAGVGLLLSAAGLAAVIYNLDLDELEKGAKKKGYQADASAEDNAKFQGRDVRVIGAGEDKRIVAEGKEQDTELVETGTSSVPYFPRTVVLPSSASAASAVGAVPGTSANPGNIRNDEEYTLVGLGIRTVSIFSIQVYVLGLYVRTADISTLQSRLIHHINRDASTLVPAEKDQLKQDLVEPTKSTEIWEQILKDTSIKSAWRIVPTRNTDFAHLRDGWITGINKGTQAATAAARAKGTASGPAAESEYESEAFGTAVKDFRNIFTAGGRAAKGSIVTLVRDESGSLDILFQEEKAKSAEKLGRVLDARIGRLVWMGYLAGKNVSSEAARKGVADGCVALAARPVGSVETMVT